MEKGIVIDIETTGLDPYNNKITEIAGIKIIDGTITDSFCQLINPEVLISNEITQLTGITNEMVKNKPTIDDVLIKFIDFCEDYDLMGHNLMFDFSFIKANVIKQKLQFNKKGIDTLRIARTVLKNLEKRSLTFLCDYYEIKRDNQHRAYDDALATYKLYKKMKKDFYCEENKDLFCVKPLHWKPKKNEPITERQEKYLLDLVRKNKIVLIKPVKDYSKSEASKEIDFIIKNYGKS